MANHPLRDWRLSRGWTLDDMAESVDVDKASISRVETGKQHPSLGLVIRLMDVSKLPIEVFYPELRK